MDKASEALFALKPVSFRYKQEIDPARSPDFGLIAEDVATVNPDLVARDEEGKIVTVRYQAVNTMLLNEFLKEHRKVEEQEAAITQLKSTVVQQQKEFQAAIAQQQREMEAITARVKEQASQIQKVSAQLELSKSALQTVVNDQ
jgi:septal ring factor EnvC (AmiA/AmiB activator)